MIKRLGLCWDGTEQKFEDLLLGTAGKFDDFSYLEIGICYCQTLQSAYLSLRENRSRFRITGVDPVPIPQQDFKDDLSSDSRIRIFTNTAQVFFNQNKEVFHFVIIDGCHSEACTMSDFISVEKFSVPGTVVLFHDFQIGCQGQDMQPHCNQPIGVRRAVENLGLFSGSRNGWKQLDTIVGTNGSEVAVFERVL